MGLLNLKSGLVENDDIKAAAGIVGSKLATNARRHVARTPTFNIDNGAGVTIDHVLTRLSVAITILAARAVPTTEAAGVVAAATVQIGTTVGGAQIAAAVALTDAAAVGAAQALTLVTGAVAANTPVIVRHTGIAATAAGEYYVEIEYTVDD